MDSTLSYETPRPARRHDVLGWVLLVVGAGMLAIGVAFGVMTWDMLQRQMVPGAELGPKQYLIGVLRGFVWITVLLITAGLAGVLVGWRRVRKRGNPNDETRNPNQ